MKMPDSFVENWHNDLIILLNDNNNNSNYFFVLKYCSTVTKIVIYLVEENKSEKYAYASGVNILLHIKKKDRLFLFLKKRRKKNNPSLVSFWFVTFFFSSPFRFSIRLFLQKGS